jgi:phosphoribosylformimino-5-aminoimidazole carboxamide ribotide isomerase
MLIYPAIDIRDGKCVRLRQGNFDLEMVWADSPLEVARLYAEAGFRNLHVVDLDGARSGRLVNTHIIEQIAALASVRIQVGGGIRSRNDITTLLTCGVDRVILGSIALHQREDVLEWLSDLRSEQVAFAVDIDGGTLAAHGWTDTTDVTPESFLRSFIAAGYSRFICTDIARDGMKSGPALPLYERLLSEFPSLELVASGGVASIEDVRQLHSSGVFGTIVGTALLDGSIPAAVLKGWDDTTNA